MRAWFPIIAHIEHASLLWEFVFSQEPDLPPANPEHVFLEIDARLMCPQHVETEQEIDVPSLLSRMKKEFIWRKERGR